MKCTKDDDSTWVLGAFGICRSQVKFKFAIEWVERI